MFFDNSFAVDGLLSGEGGAFGETNLSSVLLGFSDALAYTRVKVGNFFFGLVKGGFDLFFCKCHHKVVDGFYVALKESIDCSIAGSYI